jgi:hypothetical protein
LVGLAIIGATGPSVATAAGAEIQAPEEQLEVTLGRPGPGRYTHRHVLALRVFPLRGVAVVLNETNDFDIENHESVHYAERIPKGPFDGYLDLHFKGLGNFVGEFVPSESPRSSNPKGCSGQSGESASGALEGRVGFRGGGFASWSATRAPTYLKRSFRLRCRKGAAERQRLPKTLFGYVGPGFGFFNHYRYLLEARRKTAHRDLYLSVAKYETRKGGTVDSDATDFEWLPGEIATSRFVARSAHGDARLTASEGGYHPEHAALRPPSPFSGSGVYSRRTHRLTGSLAVEFPGLKLRIGGADTVANLRDEAGLPEKSPSEHL